MGSVRTERGPSRLGPRPVPAVTWFTDDQAGLPGKGEGSLTSHWDHMPPPLVTQWVRSCPGPSNGKGGRSQGPTWSLAAFLGQGRERKYTERVAPGLAIWVEMLAARVGARKEGGGWAPESGSQPSQPRDWSPELGGQPVGSGSPVHLWAGGSRHPGRGSPRTWRGKGVLAVLFKPQAGLIPQPPRVTLGKSQPLLASLLPLRGVTLLHPDCLMLAGEGQSDPPRLGI